MHRFIIIFTLCSLLCGGQTIKQCKDRFDAYLNFKGSLNNYVRFEDHAINMYNSKGTREFSIYAHEIDMLAEFFEHTTYKQQEELMRLKGTKKYTKRQRDSVWIYIDDRKKLPKKKRTLPLEGMRIAIDPGHFAANLADAAIEQKYLYFSKDTLNKESDSIKIFESELTFNTAVILQKMLEEQGAKVFLTRTANNFTSYNCTYTDWIKLHKKRVLDSLKNAVTISDERYNKLLKLNSYKLFWEFFRDHDIINRAKKINEFNPHASIIIHYNVDEKNEPWKSVTNKDFTMAFIGGAFVNDNFEKQETKLHFMRLLLTKQLSQSGTLAGLTVAQFTKNLGVQPASQADASYLSDNCMYTGTKGVFARNLMLCRLINSPLVYGEAFYQDNEKECAELMKRNVVKYGISTNDRVLKTALSYYQAVMQFFKN